MRPAPPTRSPFVPRAGFVLVPALLAVAVYAITLGAGFVYDDDTQIVRNPWVRELRHFPTAVTQPVWAFQTEIATNYFRPFQTGAYNLTWAVSGGRPFAFHLVNVLFHAAAAALLAGLAFRVTGDRLVALGAGLLFAVHPLNSEAVAWIACLPDLGYATFALAALLLHVLAWDAASRRRVRLKAAELAAFALAILAKETAIVVPPLVFALEAGVRPGARLRHAAKACIPYAVVVGLYSLLRLYAVGGIAPLKRTGLTAWDAVLNGPWLLLAYLGKMLWPARLVAYHVFEPVASMDAPAFWLAAPAVLALAVVAVRLARRRADLAFAAGLVLLPLLPILYVPAIGLNAFAERYAYLPTAGFTWILAAAIVAAAGKLARDRARAVAVVTFVVLAVPAAAHTVSRSRVWHDDERLASTTIRQSPGSRTMWSLLAGAYRTSDRPQQAIEVLQQALERFPGDPFLTSDLIGVRISTRAIKPGEAVRQLEAIVARGWAISDIYVYLGRAYQLAENPRAAERAYRKAIELNPSSRPAYNGLVLALIAQGRTEVDQVGLLEEAGFDVGGELDRLIAGLAQLRADEPDLAERTFNGVLHDFPGSPGAELGLGRVAARRSDHAAAIEHCRRAVEAAPELVEAHQQIGMSAMALGRMEQAVAAFETAVELSPYDAPAHNRLGVAYVRAGRTEDARRAWQRALELDPDFEGARANLERLESLH